jgi:glycosyltransferase involved in cell wall biosynthesis
VKKVMFLPADFAGCGQFRIIQPVRDIQKMDTKDLQFDLIHDFVSNNLPASELFSILSSYHAAVFQRVSSPGMLRIMKECKNIGMKIYLELDDALFHVSKTNPAYKVWAPNSEAQNVLKEALNIADKLLFSTEELISVFNKPNVVFHNAIDFENPIYSAENNRRGELPMDKKIVGWAGSSSHMDSLMQIRKPIKKLISQRDDVIFALCSNKEFLDLFDIPDDRKIYIPHEPFDKWPPVMSMFDVNLATVVPGLFNSCKSELKVLEAGVWGVPSVCTYEAPYARFRKKSGGGNFIVYENNVNDWVNNINKLLDDEMLYIEMSKKTHNTVQTTYNLREVNKKRVEFFKSELF